MKSKLWQSSRTPRDLLAYIGWQGVGYALRKHYIERYECDPLLGRGYQYAGVEKDAPPKVLEHWRRLGGVEVIRKPKLLDLFCCAGGAGMGYHRAGFDVTGVDIAPQKNYPFKFIQADALDYLREHGHEYDVIHASPPCQFAAQMFCPTKPELKLEHKNLIPDTRKLLQALGKPYVIENVKGARKHLINPLKLHGSMFNLPIFRERYFEMSHPIYFTSILRRDYTPVPINSSSKVGNKHASAKVMGEAMGIDWMTKMELREAIPPAYTEWIGEHMMQIVTGSQQLTLFDAA